MAGSRMPSWLADQNSCHPVIHRFRQVSRLIQRGSVEQLEINGRILQEWHSLMKHFHADDELAIRTLNCPEPTTTALNVCHRFAG